MDRFSVSDETHGQVVKRTNKRPDPIHGFLFQLKLLMLFLYRGVRGGYSFILGTEIEEAKKFDDLVFEFTQNKKKFYRLLQAKHKYDGTKSFISVDSLFNEINGDFNLPKYFFSYLEAKKEGLFKGGIIKDVIICTNINFNDEVFKSEEIKIKRVKNKDDILEIKIGSLTKPVRYKFKEEIIPLLKENLNFYKSKSKKVLSDYNDDDIKEFINHLIFAVDCPSEQELGEIIKREIGKEFDFLSIDNIYSRFMMTMLDWLQGKERGRFISDEEGKKFFEEAKKGIPILFNIRGPVESFTGRAKQLDELHELLNKASDKTQAICITGIGGVGKSELARKYISEFRMEYHNNVLWFNAESYKTLEACFRSVASDKLGLSTKNADGEDKGLISVIEDVYRVFSNRNYLMVFDNAQHYRCKNEFDEGIDTFLPPFSELSKPHILITSRNQRWPKTIHVISLDIFEKDEAVALISNTLKTDIKECSALAEELQYFPLALQQAVSFIKNQNMKLQNIGSDFKISRYLCQRKEKGQTFLNFSFPEDSDIEYTRTVYITWNVTLDLIRKSENGNKAMKIMNILSFMAAEDIPIEIFLNLVNGYDVLSSALDILKQYSMITIHNKIISLEEQAVVVNVHGLVQEVIRLKLVEENKYKLVLEEALMIFKKRENVNNKSLNHAISVWNYSIKDGILSDDKRRLCSLVSIFISNELLDNEQYTELYSFGQKAIAYSSSLPVHYKGVQACLEVLRQNKGIALQALGKYKEAMETFQEALLSRETMPALDDQYSLIKSLMAQNMLKQGDYKEAIKLSSKLLSTQNKMSSQSHSFLLEKLTLAKSLRAEGKDDEALDILKDIKNNISQPESTESKQLLAHVLHLEGKLEDALQLYQTLDYSKEVTSVKNTQNLNKKFSIAQIYFDQKKYPEALKEFEEVVTIGSKIFGENNPETLWSQYIIAEIHRKQGNSHKALKLFKETYEKQKNVLGKDHPDTLQTLFGQAITLEDQGKLSDSLAIYQEVWKKRINKLGKSHPSSLEAYNSIGDILYKMKNYDKAREKYNEVINLRKKVDSKDDNLDLMTKIGKIYFNKSKINRALPIFKDTIKDNNGFDHSDYQSEDKYDLAFEYVQKQKCQTLGKENSKTALQNDVLTYPLSIEALFTAVKQNKDTEFIKELVTSGCDFNSQDDEGRTLLHHAVNQGNIENTRYLLAIGVDFTKVTKKGNSCLHTAVLKGNRDIVKVLLQHLSHSRSRKFIDLQTSLGGMAALHLAAKNNNLDLVRTLLKYGAKYNILNSDKKKPIELAKDDEVKTILQLVNDNFNLVGCGGVKADKLKALRDEDLVAVVNARNENGMTMLHVAIKKKDPVSAARLFDILHKMKYV